MLKETKKIKQTQLELICEASLEEMAPCLNKAAKRISQEKKLPDLDQAKLLMK